MTRSKGRRGGKNPPVKDIIYLGYRDSLKQSKK